MCVYIYIYKHTCIYIYLLFFFLPVCYIHAYIFDDDLN